MYPYVSLYALKQYLYQILDQNSFNDEIWSLDFFQDEWLARIDGNPRLDKEVINTPEVRQWFNFIDDPNDALKSTYNCRICAKAEEFKIRKNMRTDQSNPNGVVLKKYKSENSLIIREHHEKATHKIIIQEMKRKKVKQVEAEIDALLLKKVTNPDNYPYLVTAIHLRLVYNSIRNYASFSSHLSSVEVMEKSGVFTPVLMIYICFCRKSTLR